MNEKEPKEPQQDKDWEVRIDVMLRDIEEGVEDSEDLINELIDDL